jgi:hypothetical protein
MAMAHQNELGQFACGGAVPRGCLALLPLIVDENPLTGFYAAIFCLSKFHDVIEGPIFNVIAPLFAEARRVDQKCFVGSVELGIPVYRRLMKYLQDVIQEILVKLFSEFRFAHFLLMADKTHTSLKKFLVANSQIDSRFPIDELRTRLTDVEVPEVLKQEIRAARWPMWARALA